MAGLALPPAFFVSVASKGLSVSVSGLESTLTGDCVSVDSKGTYIALKLCKNAGFSGIDFALGTVSVRASGPATNRKAGASSRARSEVIYGINYAGERQKVKDNFTV